MRTVITNAKKMQIQSIPLFVQVAETIKTRIANHEYGPGDCIPSARELEKAFNVSNITIRRAVEQLARDGYIIPRRGMRPQVVEPKNSRVEIEITGDFRTWVDSATGKKLGITAKLMERRTMVCPMPIREMLHLEPKQTVQRIKRVRSLNEIPISYYITYGASRLFSNLPSREVEEGPFVDVFQKACQIKLRSMAQTVQASIADLDLAQILKVDFGFPLFFVQNIYYTEKEHPVAITHMYYRSDRYVYMAKQQLSR